MTRCAVHERGRGGGGAYGRTSPASATQVSCSSGDVLREMAHLATMCEIEEQGAALPFSVVSVRPQTRRVVHLHRLEVEESLHTWSLSSHC